MTREMHNVSMLTDKEITIEGETYSLERGDIVALSFKTARNYVNQFGIANFVGRKYPVVDEEYEETVGPTGDTAEGLEDEETNEDEGVPLPEYLDASTVDSVERDVAQITEEGINKESTQEDDVAYLEALLNAEQDNQDRKGVKTAIEDALEELEDSGSNDTDAEQENQDEE